MLIHLPSYNEETEITKLFTRVVIIRACNQEIFFFSTASTERNPCMLVVIVHGRSEILGRTLWSNYGLFYPHKDARKQMLTRNASCIMLSAVHTVWWWHFCRKMPSKPREIISTAPSKLCLWENDLSCWRELVLSLTTLQHRNLVKIMAYKQR